MVRATVRLRGTEFGFTLSAPPKTAALRALVWAYARFTLFEAVVIQMIAEAVEHSSLGPAQGTPPAIGCDYCVLSSLLFNLYSSPITG